MARTLFISFSPFVIILKIAFRSAQIPSEQEVSTHTPMYIFPDADSTAAATPPADILSEISRALRTASAALNKSVHICFIHPPPQIPVPHQTAFPWFVQKTSYCPPGLIAKIPIWKQTDMNRPTTGGMRANQGYAARVKGPVSRRNARFIRRGRAVFSTMSFNRKSISKTDCHINYNLRRGSVKRKALKISFPAAQKNPNLAPFGKRFGSYRPSWCRFY